MLIPNHPGDERLSALAAQDDDAVADAALATHVSACTRCTDLVTELGALRASLSEMPDLVPHRPLRLLPPIADASATGAAGWVRRLFAPALTAGAAIAMIGLVGTAGPLVGGMASGSGVFQDAGADLQEAAQEPGSSEAQALSTDDVDRESVGGAPAAGEAPDATADQLFGRYDDEGVRGGDDGEVEGGEPSDGLTTLPAERSVWPMVLFTGIALMVAAALLRWILVPRAG